MTLIMTPNDIVDLTAIQNRTGASMRAIVSEWWPHPHFPRPMKVFEGGPVWYWPSVLSWIERTREVIGGGA